MLTQLNEKLAGGAAPAPVLVSGSDREALWRSLTTAPVAVATAGTNGKKPEGSTGHDKALQDRRALLSGYQGELEACTREIQALLRRQKEASDRVAALQAEINQLLNLQNKSKGASNASVIQSTPSDELSFAKAGFSNRISALESLLLDTTPLPSSSTTATSSSEKSQSVGAAFAHAASFASVQVKCIQMLAGRVASCRDRLKSLAEERTLYQTLNMKVCSSQSYP